MRDIDPLPQPQHESETSDYTNQFNITDRRRLVTKGVLHYSGQAASVLSSLLLVPFMLQRLGAEAYGLWIVALATPALVVALDNSLYYSITRETAAHRGLDRISDAQTRSFLSACCGAYLVFGLLAGVFVLVAGQLMSRHIPLSPELRRDTASVFAAVAVAFVPGRAVVFANAVLSGFQRFGTVNAISVGALVARFAGFMFLLARHSSLSAIAFWYGAVALAEGGIALRMASILGAIKIDRSLLQWRLLRRIGAFGLWSFLTTEILNLGNFIPPFLLGFLTGGTAATTSLYIGQRPGWIVSEFNWRGGEILYSEVASDRAQRSPRASAAMMIFGSSCLLAVSLPLCTGMLILAPAIVSVWLRVAQPETVTIMRLNAVAVIGDALLVAPMHVLWGRGLARRVLAIASAITASILLLNFLLIPRLGASGSAIATTISTWLGVIVTTIAACRELDASWLRSLFSPLSRLLLPGAVLAISTYMFSLLLHDSPRLLLLTASGVGGILYAIIFIVHVRLQPLVRAE